MLYPLSYEGKVPICRDFLLTPVPARIPELPTGCDARMLELVETGDRTRAWYASLILALDHEERTADRSCQSGLLPGELELPLELLRHIHPL